MINKIAVKNFKCFENFELPLKSVNILSGINGMGKSTMIQSLLLLRQSALKSDGIKGLHLNGEYLLLGSGQDILYERAEEERIELGYGDGKGEHSWTFQYLPDSDFLPVINRNEKNMDSELFGKYFSYLSAYRIPPQDLYRIRNEEEINSREFGNDGEYALQYLNYHWDDTVENENVILPDKMGNSLGNQIKVWMDRISPGISPQVAVNMQLRKSEVRYEFVEGREKTKSYKSINVGFGITYVLPLMIALVSAKKGDIIIIENPEAHIHPAGQRALGELIARVGMGGVQVIAETHSDHILNGVRLAVKNRVLSKEETILSFFYKDFADGYRHKCIHPEILQDGRLDRWPDGFFDEWDKALYELL